MKFLQSERETLIGFVKNAVDYCKNIESGNSKAANLAGKRNKKIIAQLGDFSTDFLKPLLSYPSDSVRFVAAAHLMKTEVRDDAVKVLHNLAQCPSGLMALSARAILDIYSNVS
jgi:hypothetical protein